jgi:MFS family permease
VSPSPAVPAAGGDGPAGTASSPSPLAPPSTAWSPLTHPVFRALWIASVASNLGTWMQSVGATWLMTSLTPSPLPVAMMQVATSLPVFLVGLPAGALADIVDRRRMLLFTQGWMLAAAALMGFLALTGQSAPWSLLALTFALGLGGAMNSPVWQAITPELVPRGELPSALALSSVSFNIARAVGPALGGLLVAAAGPGAVFLLNALSFVGVMAVIYRWSRPSQTSALPAERVLAAMRTGVRYMRFAPTLQRVFARTGIFIAGASALWALLPLVALKELGLGSFGYGVLLGCLGIGAVAGALVLPVARRRASADGLVVGATLLFALATFVLGVIHNTVAVGAALLVGGAGWTMFTSSANLAAQAASPSWVRARPGYVSPHFPGQSGGRKRPLGCAGRPPGRAGRPHLRGGHPCRRRAGGPALAPVNAPDTRPPPLGSCPGAAPCRRASVRRRPGTGDDRVPGRPGQGGRLRPGHAGRWARPAPDGGRPLGPLS